MRNSFDSFDLVPEKLLLEGWFDLFHVDNFDGYLLAGFDVGAFVDFGGETAAEEVGGAESVLGDLFGDWVAWRARGFHLGFLNDIFLNRNWGVIG